MSSVDQAVIDLDESVSIWGVPGLEVDSFVQEVKVPGQLLHLRLPSPISRHDLGRLLMPAPAVHKIDPWPPLLSHLLVHLC
jgi:hypothetical protein